MTAVEPPIVPVRRGAVVFIFFTVMLDMLAFGIIIPVFPHLVQEMTGGELTTAAQWTGIMGASFGLMQFLFSPVQGALSDRFGRRPVILLSNLGLGLDLIVMALAQSLPLLFIGRLISGISAASFTTANAYIADVTPKEKRAASYGLLGAAVGIGFVLGPALGGLLGAISPRLPFWVAAGLALANFLYGYFILPESLPKERRSARFDLRGANPLGALKLLRRYPQVLWLAVVLFLVQLSQFSLNSTFVLFADYRFQWGAQEVGYTLALMGLFSGLVQAVLLRKLVPRFGERRLMLAGMLFGIGAFITFGIATNPTVFLFGMPLLALWGLGGPSTQSLMTQQVDASEQGRLQGAISSLAGLATIIGPILFSQVFAASIAADAGYDLPGAAFLLSALLVVVGFVLGWRVTATIKPVSLSSADNDAGGTAAVETSIDAIPKPQA